MGGLKAPETKEQTVIHVGWDLSVCVKGRPRLDSREAGQCPGNLSHVPKEMGVVLRRCGAWEVRACGVRLHML